MVRIVLILATNPGPPGLSLLWEKVAGMGRAAWSRELGTVSCVTCDLAGSSVCLRALCDGWWIEVDFLLYRAATVHPLTFS